LIPRQATSRVFPPKFRFPADASSGTNMRWRKSSFLVRSVFYLDRETRSSESRRKRRIKGDRLAQNVPATCMVEPAAHFFSVSREKWGGGDGIEESPLSTRVRTRPSNRRYLSPALMKLLNAALRISSPDIYGERRLGLLESCPGPPFYQRWILHAIRFSSETFAERKSDFRRPPNSRDTPM